MKLRVVLTAVALFSPLALASPARATSSVAERVSVESRPAAPGARVRPPGAAGRALESRGYLTRDAGAYASATPVPLGPRDTAAVGSRSTARSGVRAGPRTVSTPAGAEGTYDDSGSPSDSTGAIGTARYVELVNVRFEIYDRTDLATPLSSGTLQQLIGRAGAALTDPQVMWDPDSARFYYAVLEYTYAAGGATPNYLHVGFSKTASPSSASDWCSWVSFNFGSDLPDYPKLGDTRDFLLIGANTFNAGGSFTEADVIWSTKPKAGATTCSTAGTPVGGVKAVFEPDGVTPVWTPVPASQTDSSSQGWVVAVPNAVPASALEVISVTRASNGTATIQSSAREITTPSTFAMPAAAPQGGSSSVLDTLDGRLTQAVSAIDPGRGCDRAAIWTQHTVAGGAGALVRWYEIDPVAGSLFQTGDVSDPALFVYNGAVSPDRAVNGTSREFGDSMVIGFNTSSATQDVAIQMASKTGNDALSPWVLVKQSPGPNDDATCGITLPGDPDISCRWGDYSGATPDPGASTTGGHGSVWLTNAWNVTSTDSVPDWRTWNWQATVDGTSAPSVQFRPDVYALNENGGTVTLTVARSRAATGEVTVEVAVTGGTAATGSDYTNPGTVILTFPDGGALTQTFGVAVINDSVKEPDETITLGLSNATGGASIGCASAATVTIRRSDQQPDGHVRVAGGGSYLGNNVYNSTASGQTISTSAKRGTTRVFYARAQNDGNASNAFTMRAYVGSASGYSVRFYVGTGSTNITSAMLAGTYSTGTLAPAAAKIVRIEIRPGSTAAIGSAKSVLVRATWSGDSTRSDSVKAVLKTVS